MTDNPWDIFTTALLREMAVSRVSAKDMAAGLNRRNGVLVSEDTVSNWRRGRARPSLDLLSPIVDVLNEQKHGIAGQRNFTLLGLLQEMHVLPEDVSDGDLFDRSYRLHKLNMKLESATDAAAELGRSAGAARIVQEATLSGKWAVAVWPALEGPDPVTQMHVADRIDIRYIGHETSANYNAAAAIWADPGMKSALRSTHAVPSNTVERWSAAPDQRVTHWSISHVGSPRDPIVSDPWPGLGSLCVLSSTRGSWVQDLAALVSLALGYGLTTTSNLAMTMTGRSDKTAAASDRYALHSELLKHSPRRRVWAHFGFSTGDGSPFGNSSAEGDYRTRFIYLDESDDLIADSIPEDRLATVLEARNTVRAHSNRLPPSHLLRLDTALVNPRTERWNQVFEQTDLVLRWLSEEDSGVSLNSRSLKDAHAAAQRRLPGVAEPLLSWLRTRGWPAQ